MKISFLVLMLLVGTITAFSQPTTAVITGMGFTNIVSSEGTNFKCFYTSYSGKPGTSYLIERKRLLLDTWKPYQIAVAPTNGNFIVIDRKTTKSRFYRITDMK